MSDPTTPVPQSPQGPQPATSPGASGPAGGPGRWLGEATSTTGGKIAMVVAAVLGTMLLVAGIGLVAALGGGDEMGRGGGDRASMSERGGPGNGKGLGQGMGNAKAKGQGNGQGKGNGNGNGNGNSQGKGNGNRGGLGVAGIDDVLHGEFTTNVTGTPTVMVVQSGQVTAYTAGQSLTVRSPDGFEATYVVDGGVASTRGATELAAGVQVRVVAAKEGMTVTRLTVG